MAAPSRRHWTKMFVTKHTCNQDCQTPCPRCSANTSSGAAPREERTQELKPRWTPKPEQVRILQYIFDSGNITPTREEIRDIRAQLQEYGEVGEANVFYWFQNRKSRNKSKKRHSTISQTEAQTSSAAPPLLPYSSACFQNLSSPPTAAFRTESPLTWPAPATTEPFLSSDTFLPEGQLEGFGFSDPSPWTSVPFGGGDHHHQTPGGESGFVANEMMMNYQNEVPSYSNVCGEMYNSSASMPSAVRFDAAPSDSIATGTSWGWSSISQPEVHGFESADIGGEPVPDMGSSSSVFINDVAFDVGFSPFNVREVFGDDAMLIHSSGDPIITDDMGFCLQPLQHGAFYYLVHRGAR